MRNNDKGAEMIENINITLAPEGDRIRVTVKNAEGTVYTRSTKYDANMVGRIERYLADAGIRRETSYSNSGDAMVAEGRRAA